MWLVEIDLRLSAVFAPNYCCDALSCSVFPVESAFKSSQPPHEQFPFFCPYVDDKDFLLLSLMDRKFAKKDILIGCVKVRMCFLLFFTGRLVDTTVLLECTFCRFQFMTDR